MADPNIAECRVGGLSRICGSTLSSLDVSARSVRFCGSRSNTSKLIVVIPARNEQRRVSECLSALAASIRQSHHEVFVIIVANNCHDDTVNTSVQQCKHFALNAAILEVLLPGNQGVGLARSMGISYGLNLAPAAMAVLTTDADCQVMPDWIDCAMRILDQFDMVCGRVAPLTHEAATLPCSIHEPGVLEHTYLQLILHTESLLDPDLSNPWPYHGRASGANQGFRRKAYVDSGGYASLLTNEDQEIAQRFRHQGRRVRYANELLVNASCRLSGRAPDGMADALARRIANTDSVADSLLEPARTHLLRVSMRVQCRKRVIAGLSLAPLGKLLGLSPDALDAQQGAFEQRWPWLELHAPALRRQRLRPSQLPEQIAYLNAARERLLQRSELAESTP